MQGGRVHVGTGMDLPAWTACWQPAGRTDVGMGQTPGRRDNGADKVKT